MLIKILSQDLTEAKTELQHKNNVIITGAKTIILEHSRTRILYASNMSNFMFPPY